MAKHGQSTDKQNMGDPVNGIGKSSPSPTHGQSPAWRPMDDKATDNNVHRAVLPMERHVHHSE